MSKPFYVHKSILKVEESQHLHIQYNTFNKQKLPKNHFFQLVKYNIYNMYSVELLLFILFYDRKP